MHSLIEDIRMRLLTILLLVLALSACTAVPEQIQGEFASITPVRVEPGVFGTDERWGGVIMLSLIHISEPTRPAPLSRMPTSE